MDLGTTTEEPKGQGQPNGAPPTGAAAGGTNGEPHPPLGTPTPGKNLVLSPRAWGDALQKERDRGKRQMLAELDKQAQDLGFKDHAALREHATRMGKSGGSSANGKPDGQPAVTPPSGSPPPSGDRQGQPNDRADRKAVARMSREIDQLKQALEAERKQRQLAEKRAREAQRKLDAYEARTNLEKAAIVAGVKDVDFAVQQLLRAQEGKTEEELKSFDEVKFFEGMRTERPYLFGEQVRPATTGTGPSGAPPAPNPGQATQKAANDGQADARKLNQDQFNDRLKELGINPHFVPGT